MRIIMILLISLLCMIGSVQAKGEFTILKSPRDFIMQWEWDQLLSDVKSSTTKFVVIDWAGVGGDVEMATDFYKALAKLNKNIIIDVTGEAGSSHGLVLCYLPARFKVEVGGYVMLHGVRGNVSNTSNRIYSDHKTGEIMDQCVKAGVITQTEEKAVVDDHMRVYINTSGHKIVKDWL